MNFVELHNRAMDIAKKFRQAESELIDILQEIEAKKVFQFLGYSSLFDYSVRALKLSEASAYNYITVARKSRSVPDLKEAIRSGDVSVATARKITAVLTAENSQHWLNLAKTLSKQNLEKEVAKIAPQALTTERTRYVTQNRLELRMGISEEQMQDFKRAQDLVSQRLRRAATLEATLVELLSFYLERKDPIALAKRNFSAANKANPRQRTPQQNTQEGHLERVTREEGPSDASAPVPGQERKRGGKRYIPARVRHAVQLRDEGRCTFVGQQDLRCENRRFLEIHHRQHFSQGGGNEPENLTTYCWLHHDLVHQLSLPLDGQINWVRSPQSVYEVQPASFG